MAAHEIDLDDALRAHYERSSSGIFVMDRSGMIQAANRSMVAILGSPDEGLTRTFNAYDLPTLDADVKAAFRRVAAGGEPEILRLEYTSMHGRTVDAELELIPVASTENGDGPCLVGVIRDVSELTEAQEVVRRASKMETLNILAAGLAHDLNNIFGAVVGYASMLRDLSPTHERFHRYLGNLVEVAGGGAQLVDRLLTFTSERLVDQTSCDLTRSIRRVEGLLGSYIKGDIDATVSVEESLPLVRGSATRIEQALANLLVNARDAVDAKGAGTIRITARLSEVLPERWVLKPVDNPLGWVEVRVEDDGIGIDAPDPAAVFEPYFTTKPIGRGTGLGLSIVYGVVKAIRGGIAVRSKVGRGTTFSLFLPVVGETWKEDTIRVLGSLAGEGERVLILERDQGIREFTTWVLLRNDYKVLAASTVRDAVSILADRHDDLDAFLAEAELPPPEVAKLVAMANRYEIPIIAATSGGRQATIPGAATLLTKPFGEEELLTAVKRVLARSSRNP
ncbi:MAG: ATP-binding protein [Pseudomonadota bacterium]